jgi:hypothetical protein
VAATGRQPVAVAAAMAFAEAAMVGRHIAMIGEPVRYRSRIVARGPDPLTSATRRYA